MEKRFSSEINSLLSGRQITLQDAVDSFRERSFAVLFLILMLTPALPLPTGGFTHIFELIVMLLSLELVVGQKTPWLPRRWLRLKLPGIRDRSGRTKFIKAVRWIEARASGKNYELQNNILARRGIGLIVFILAGFAFIAPPFSGLDTLPSLGVVVLSLGLIFKSPFLEITGPLIGSIGIGLIVLLGRFALSMF
jgi:hypothetical protein